MLKTFRRTFKNFKREIRHRRKILDEAQAIARAASGHTGPKIFVDCGFNQCKVMGMFAGALPDFIFYGFEANSNFKPQSDNVKRRHKNVRDMNFSAVSTTDGEASFFLAGDESGAHIQEGSTMVMNKDAHQTDFTKPTIVPTIDFSQWLKNMAGSLPAGQTPFVAVKMDIEGAEYDVLEDMVSREAIGEIDYLMIEFHSYSFKGDEKVSYERRERALLDHLRARDLVLSQWF